MDNAPSLNLGRIKPPRAGGVSGRVAGNVIIGGARRKNSRRSFTGGGIEVGNVNYKGAVVENNILIEHNAPDAAIQLSPLGVGFHNVTIRNNTIYNWTPAIAWVGEPGTRLERMRYSGAVVTGNLLQIVDPAAALAPLLRCRDAPDAAGFAFRNNIWYLPPPTTRPAAAFKGRNLSLSEWLAGPGRAGERAARVRFADPRRDIATYQAALGLEPTLEAFLREARKQSRRNWRPEFTARAVIQYIREGFRPVGEPAGARGPLRR